MDKRSSADTGMMSRDDMQRPLTAIEYGTTFPTSGWHCPQCIYSGGEDWHSTRWSPPHQTRANSRTKTCNDWALYAGKKWSI